MTRPALLPTLALTVGSLAVAAALGATLPDLPAEPTAESVRVWWEVSGTAAAAMTLVHLVATMLAAWLVLAVGSGVVASLSRSPGAARVWRALTDDRLRRLVGGSALIAAITTAPAAADDIDPGAEPLDLQLIDAGPSARPSVAGDDGIILADIGPSPHPDEGDVSAERHLDTWTIARGDHLWRVAEETLVDRGHEPSEADVAAYWRRLIDANRDVIGSDPDIVYPGQVVHLPDEPRGAQGL